MSKNTSKNEKKAEIKGFFGIDRSYFSGERGCEQIKNFRVDGSGALIKRPGRKKLFRFEKPVVSAIDYTISSPAHPTTNCLVAAPPYLHAIDLSGSDSWTVASDLGVGGSEVGLTLYRRDPYLFDGSSIRTFSESLGSFSRLQGYAPLYGKDWDPASRGPINEPLNQLGGHARISYNVKSYTDSLYIGREVMSVYRVEINGVATENYINEGFSVIGEFPDGSHVEIWCLFSYFGSGLNACRAATSVLGGTNERLIAYRGDSDTSVLYCSAPVSDSALEESRRGFPESKPVYFPEELKIDLKGTTVKSVCSCGDGFIIFTERHTLLVVPDGLSYELYTLSASVGCVAPHAAFAKNRRVYTFSADGIYRFDVDVAEPYDTEVKKISDVLEGGDDFIIDSSCKIFENHADGELWFCCPGSIFIYNIDSDMFYTYTDLYARAMISHQKSVYLFDRYNVWQFSDSYFYDEADGMQTEIEAVAVSRWIDFGDITEQKKILTVHPIYETDKHLGFSVSVVTDSGLEYGQELYGDESPAPSQRKLRISRCRFKCVQLKISCTSGSRPKIYGAVLSAQS